MHCIGWCAIWPREPRTSKPSWSDRSPRSSVSSRSFITCSARSSVAGQSGWMVINSRSGWKTSMSTLPGCWRRWPRPPMRMLPTLRHDLDHSRRAWRAKTSHATSQTRPAPAVAVRCMRSARVSARCSTSFRHACVCCASAGRSTAAAPAGRSIRHQHRSVRSPRDWPALPCSPTCWSANTAITRRSTDSPRSSPAMVSSLTGRPWRTGSVGRAGGWSRCRRAWPPMCSDRTRSSPTTCRSRCSILAAVAPRPADYGSIRAMIDPGRVPIHPPQSTSTVRTARRNVPPPTLRASAAFSRSTAMRGSSG